MNFVNIYFETAIFICIRTQAFKRRTRNNNKVRIMNNERVESSDYQIVRRERKGHYPIWHKRVPNFHIWHKRVPRNFIIPKKSVFVYVITFLKLVTKHFAHVVQKLDSWLAQGSDDPTLSLFMNVTFLLFLVRRLKAWVLMQINMAVSKVDIYKIHPKNLHISRIFISNLEFLKYLQARYWTILISAFRSHTR